MVVYCFVIFFEKKIEKSCDSFERKQRRMIVQGLTVLWQEASEHWSVGWRWKEEPDINDLSGGIPEKKGLRRRDKHIPAKIYHTWCYGQEFDRHKYSRRRHAETLGRQRGRLFDSFQSISKVKANKRSGSSSSRIESQIGQSRDLVNSIELGSIWSKWA